MSTAQEEAKDKATEILDTLDEAFWCDLKRLLQLLVPFRIASMIAEADDTRLGQIWDVIARLLGHTKQLRGDAVLSSGATAIERIVVRR